MVLTKKEAIKWHRKMWRWIASQYKAGRTEWVTDLKEEYCSQRGLSVCHNCFCCEYATNQTTGDYCNHCPVTWGTEEETVCYFCESEEQKISPYWELFGGTNPESDKKISTEEAYKLALQIAELPEKR